MAFVLTPRLAPAYQAPQCTPFGLCGPVSRPTYTYRVSRPQPRRPQYSSFNHFFHQVDELLSDIDREAQRHAQVEARLEAQREAHRQREQQKRALRARFAISQNEQGWLVDGDIHGFEQENISIEVADEHTLNIAANTQWQSEKAYSEPQQYGVKTTPEQPTEAAQNDTTDRITPSEPEGETAPDSDTDSHKSYQATVEDDFEDLGAEISSLISTPSGTSTPAAQKEPKGKETAAEEPVAAETAAAYQPQPETPIQRQQEQGQEQEQEQPKEQGRVHGSFERTFKFPERIDIHNVSASFKDGALRITVPKAHIPQVRRIAIQ